MNGEQTRAALMVLALGAGAVVLLSLAGGKTASRGHRRSTSTKARKRRTKPTAKQKKFDGKGYSFAGSHHYKADAQKAADALRKQGRSVRVAPFRWSASNKPQWGVFVR